MNASFRTGLQNATPRLPIILTHVALVQTQLQEHCSPMSEYKRPQVTCTGVRQEDEA